MDKVDKILLGILIGAMLALVFCFTVLADPNVMPTDSYSFTIIPDTTPPYTDGHNPAKNETDVYPGKDVVVHIKDAGVGVDILSIVMTVNGQVINPVITGDKKDYTLTYDPSEDFQEGSTIYVTVEASDLNP